MNSHPRTARGRTPELQLNVLAQQRPKPPDQSRVGSQFGKNRVADAEFEQVHSPFSRAQFLLRLLDLRKICCGQQFVYLLRRKYILEAEIAVLFVSLACRVDHDR